MDVSSLTLAFKAWQEILADRVLSKQVATDKYSTNTLGIQRIILGALIPVNVSEITEIIKIAQNHKIPLYPFSTGHNWGYGSSQPVQDNCVLVDLSKMTQIKLIDKDLGLITVEPGVTQGQLKKFLDDEKLPFYVPVTGAGPSCSVIGNALERGFGLNPYIDHIASVIALEAVLPNGDIYRSPTAELNKCPETFQWGLGPYVTGLFAQSNFGIVTAMTLQLARKKETEIGVIFNVESDEDFLALIPALREILQEFGAYLGSIKITNQNRLFNILEHFPNSQNSPEVLLTNTEYNLALKKIKRIRHCTWLGATTIYANKNVAGIIKKAIKRKFKAHSSKISFVNTQFIAHLMNVVDYFPILKNNIPIFKTLNKLNSFLKLWAGNPSDFVLPIAYAKYRKLPDGTLNPDRDGCGVITYIPMAPIQKEAVQVFLNTVNYIFAKYKVEPIITFASISNICFECTLQILFNKNDSSAVKNAHACYEALFQGGKEQGFLPYRIPVDFMKLATSDDISHWRMVKKIKQALDPENILAPGRYS